MTEIQLVDKTFQLFIPNSSILDKIDELAHQINKAYSGQQLEILVLLDGAKMFADAIMPRFEFNYNAHYQQVKSYQGMHSGGEIQFDREYIYSLDPKTVASYYKDMFDVGGLTTNEIRVRQNMPPVEGGDVAFVTANVAPITSAKIYGEPQSENKDEPAEKQDKKTTPTDKKSV